MCCPGTPPTWSTRRSRTSALARECRWDVREGDRGVLRLGEHAHIASASVARRRRDGSHNGRRRSGQLPSCDARRSRLRREERRGVPPAEPEPGRHAQPRGVRRQVRVRDGHASEPRDRRSGGRGDERGLLPLRTVRPDQARLTAHPAHPLARHARFGSGAALEVVTRMLRLECDGGLRSSGWRAR